MKNLIITWSASILILSILLSLGTMFTTIKAKIKCDAVARECAVAACFRGCETEAERGFIKKIIKENGCSGEIISLKKEADCEVIRVVAEVKIGDITGTGMYSAMMK